MEPTTSQTSITIKTTAKGQKQIDIKVYEPVPEPGTMRDPYYDIAKVAVALMQRVESECIEANYTLVGS